MKILNEAKSLLQKHLSLVIVFIAVMVAVTNYLIYPSFINQQLKLTEVPVARVSLPPNTIITSDDIDYITFPIDALPTSVYSGDEIIGMFTKADTTLVKGSLFYKDAIDSQGAVIGSQAGQLKDDEIAYPLNIDQNSGVKNLLRAGQYIEIYFESAKPLLNNQIVIGKLLEHIRIIDVVRSTANDVTSIILAVTEGDIDYLLAAKTIGSLYPLISWQTGVQDYEKGMVYDLNSLRNILDEFKYSARFHNRFLELADE
ncbi:MAG: hypothetical protein VB012_05770 [Erysipelotrichaceae bacterium]|nr:hypothetical protein [Erysipelotrichaceae bacterium]